MPGAGDPRAWDRYSSVKNSPVVYNDPSGHDGESTFLNPFSYDTVSIELSGIGKFVIGVDIVISISIDMKSVREGYSEGGVSGAMSTNNNSTFDASVTGEVSLGLSAEAVGVISVTGSDGNLDDQNGVQVIGSDGYPVNYGVVPPFDGAAGIYIGGSTTLQPDSKNGVSSSQSWGLGGEQVMLMLD